MSDRLGRLRERLARGGFARNVGILAGGAALGQALTLLASPLVSRLYTPGDFGILAVYASLLAVIAVAASLRYELAIPLPADERTAVSVLVLSLALVTGTTVVAGAAVWMFGEQIGVLVGAPEIAEYLWLLPVGVLALGLYQALSYWAVRKRAYGRIAKTRLAQGASSVVVQLGLGILQFGPVGLILGQVAGQASGTTSFVSLALRDNRPELAAVDAAGIRAAAKRYDRFPKYATAGALLNSSSVQLPSVFITALFGASVAGWYFFALRLLRAPLNMLSSSVSQVFYGEAPRLAETDPGALLTLFNRTSRRLFLLAVLPLGAIAVLGPWTFGILFGAQWTEAGVFARLLAPYLLIQFAFGPVSQIFSILESQRMLLILNGSKLVLAVGPIVIVSYLGASAQAAVFAHSLGLAMNYVASYLVGRRLIRRRIATQGEQPAP